MAVKHNNPELAEIARRARRFELLPLFAPEHEIVSITGLGRWIRDLRKGRHTQQEAMDAAESLEARLEQLAESSSLPERPDQARADKWLVEAYESTWATVWSSS